MAKRMPVAAGGGWAAPDPVLDLAAAADGIGGVTLTWTQAFGATGYDIQRSLTNSNFSSIATDQTGATYYDSSGDPNTLYYYRIIAKRNQVPSLPSNVTSATTGSAFSGVLDGYTTNLVAAYLPFRGLTSYEGDGFTIRDTVGDAEQNVGFDAVTGDLAAYTVGGSAAIKTWFNQFGAGANLAQGTAAAQALLTLNIVGGKPVARFDGANDFMSAAISAAGNRTVYLLGKFRTGTANTRLVNLTASQNADVYYDAGGSLYYYATAPNVVDPIGGTGTDWCLVTLKFTGGAALVPYVNEVTATGFNVSDITISAVLSLASDNSGTNNGAVDVAALLVYEATHDDSTRLAIRNILGTAFSQPWVP